MSFVNQLVERLRPLRVAVVHDWFFSRRGGERVLEQILGFAPHADLFLLFGKPEVLRTAASHRTQFSFLASLPGIERYYKYLLPYLPMAIESLDLTGYDVILSSSHCVAKGVIPNPLAVHVSYIHSPMRYVWDMEHEYFPHPPSFWRPWEILRRRRFYRLRQWDVTATNRVHRLLANSGFVARRCQLYYGRTAQVVHPPVELDRFTKISPHPQSPPAALLFGAWVPYKGMRSTLDRLLAANIRVIAAGQGADLDAAARQHANNPLVEFVRQPTDDQVQDLYARARMLVFPGVEDFGIVPLEAQAAGLWVVAPNRGGTVETVRDGVTGTLFPAGDMEALVAATQAALARPVSAVDRDAARAQAERFSLAHFCENYARNVVEELDLHG
ncbi:MAG: glycosyltransferase [Pirellulales bacterium]|nr:glycosyltransferase [Pirellulales bacterium]